MYNRSSLNLREHTDSSVYVYESLVVHDRILDLMSEGCDPSATAEIIAAHLAEIHHIDIWVDPGELNCVEIFAPRTMSPADVDELVMSSIAENIAAIRETADA